jgi:hypothetical protein
MVSLLQEIMIDEHQPHAVAAPARRSAMFIHSSRTASSLHTSVSIHRTRRWQGQGHYTLHTISLVQTARAGSRSPTRRVCHDEMRTSRSAVPPSRKAHEELSINPTAESPPVEGPHVAHVARSTWVGTRARAPSARWTSSPRLPRLRKGRVTKGAPRASGTRQSRPSHWSSRARRPQPWPCRRGT